MDVCYSCQITFFWDVTSYSLVDKFIQIIAAHLPNYKSKYIKLNVSISEMECCIVTILAPFWSPYTTIQCQISTWSAAFCTHCCNLEDTDLSFFLYKSRGMMAKVSWICCSRSSSVFWFGLTDLISGLDKPILFVLNGHSTNHNNGCQTALEQDMHNKVVLHLHNCPTEK